MWKGSADEEPELNGVRLKRSPYGVRLRRSSDEEPDFSGVRLRRSSDDISESDPLETLMWKGSADEEPELNGVRLKRSPYGVRLRRSSDEKPDFSGVRLRRSSDDISESGPLETLMWKGSADDEPELNG